MVFDRGRVFAVDDDVVLDFGEGADVERVLLLGDGEGDVRVVAALELDPREIGEPRVLADLRAARLARAEALVLRLEELFAEVGGARRHHAARVAGVVDARDALEDGFLVRPVGVVHKGSVPDAHLVDEDAERPVVDEIVVPLPGDDLRSHVLRRAAHGEGAVAVVREMFGEAHVDNLDVSRVVDHEVLRLQIAVHDPLAVHVEEPAEHARRDKFAVVLLEAAPVRAKIIEQLAALHKLEEHVDVVRAAKGAHHA
mmetsp:Transcript_22328/g.72433  ORF Transcript_22328/g.72433 Transcript_22328/m.72433 type:complete len:255 (-) Transcript_22328:2073-2837(-)